MFGSNSHGLAPERGLRPDKFINLATLGPSALAKHGKEKINFTRTGRQRKRRSVRSVF